MRYEGGKKKKQEKACGGHNFYQTSQCTAWIAGLSAVAVRREAFSANGANVQPALRSDPCSWQSGHGEGRNILFLHLLSLWSLSARAGQTSSVPGPSSQSQSACCGTVSAVSCLQSKPICVWGKKCGAQSSGYCQWSLWELSPLSEGQIVLACMCMWQKNPFTSKVAFIRKHCPAG